MTSFVQKTFPKMVGLRSRAAAAVLGGASIWGASACSADPSDCPIAGTCGPCSVESGATARGDECGIYVSTHLGNDANPGTRAKPMRTLAKAISTADSGPSLKGVYACAETFAEQVKVPMGVSLWGGLDCDSGDWKGTGKPTIIAPEEDVVPLSVEAEPWDHIDKPPSELVSLRVQAVDASEPGKTSIAMLIGKDAVVKMRRSDLRAGDGAAPAGSSIALVIWENATVEILESQLYAGNGGDGERGADGGDAPAASGVAGNPGAPACSADVVPGGNSVATACGHVQSIGGVGGDGFANAGGHAAPGEPPAPGGGPGPDGSGRGGTGEGSKSACTNGGGGHDGVNGQEGRGVRSEDGSFGPIGWIAPYAQDGTDGQPGSGGGGGGGSRGGAACGTEPKGGASGGSGGSGGCGGKGGKGGGPGGSSFGIYALNSILIIRSSYIESRNGGRGGDGGRGQPGGSGNIGGRGGLGRGGARNGCAGGSGGAGGNGGGGGGGVGGHSAGLLMIGHAVSGPVVTDYTWGIGQPGRGGLGAGEIADYSDGRDGQVGELITLPRF